MDMDSENEFGFFGCTELLIPAEALNGYRGYAADVGGTLAKLAYTEDDEETGMVRVRLGSLPNGSMDNLFQFLTENVLPIKQKIGVQKFIAATAGWFGIMAKHQFQDALGVEPVRVDEFDSYGFAFYHLINAIGPSRLIHNAIPCPGKDRWGTMAELRDHMINHRSRDHLPESRDALFPALVGFIGSGIGFTKIEADGRCSDIHLGSMTGGMFFYSMGRVLTHCKDYDELQSMVARGCAGNLSDVLSDIPPGTCYQMYDFDLMKEAFSHLGETLVLPFGKLGRGEVPESDIKKEDLVASLLHTICYEIMEQAVLFARWHNVRSLFFCGSFCRNNPTFSDYVQRAPLFDIKLTGPELIVGQLRYEGYVSALGSLLRTANPQSQTDETETENESEKS